MSIDFISRIIGLIIFGSLGVWLGVYLSDIVGGLVELWASVLGLMGVLVGLVLSPYIIVRPTKAFRAKLRQISARTLFFGIIGLILGLLISVLISFPLAALSEPLNRWLPLISAVFLGYFGIYIFVSRQNDVFSFWKSLSGATDQDGARSGSNKSVRQILLDTSVIIDGRIADIARTGFLSGELLIPGFVLNELQYIADSSDNLRRQRGRRGLEVLAQMQKDPLIPVNISDIDVEGSRQVDDKLVILAKQLRVPVLTNDFNLNRVAELQGVTILNINELANAVKAVYLPGEVLPVRVIQEGRESGQGVGYLDDGTMVVVQGGNNSIGIEMNTVVTKVLQTAAGRMIFARIENSK
ncbi:MAG: TRAM domain-containing protein [Chloroflexi bacterium]|nr:TRAM domain-containing protein [Chloroflexota bacterium]MBT3670530.1 TRAM domain-containing protein [Chloroflexota bacterium]MBT4002510.1 TRAM domain-containing protein [Chloroflexota bacterium]MBT4304165.1 TRAM domain-containing protein [Chloroflexota bacterium]MBT4533476.1 TRAM domain-containing protein [Chloroflexota bacterium]